MDTAAIFARDRYVVLPSLLEQSSVTKLHLYACKIAELAAALHTGDEQVPNTPCSYSDFMMDGLLTSLMPAIEQASGLTLLPTYSYFRVYKHGDELARHTDRPSCEISVTLCLGFDAEKPWPIWIQGPRSETAVGLLAGDAMLYRGMECEHWRERFEGKHQAQVFLHYVDQNGPHTEWKFDKRPVLIERPRLAKG